MVASTTLIRVLFGVVLTATSLHSFVAQAGPQTAKREQQYDAETVRRASSIARQTMSPFCPGRTLSDCPSEYAAEWRSDIRRMVANGKSPSEIQAALEKRAGGNLSGIPNRRSSYAVPIGLSLAAAVFLGMIFLRLLRKEEKKKIPASISDSTTSEVDDDRLNAELEAEEPDD